MIDLLEKWGYDVRHDIMDTKHHGIPQSRPRFYLVAIHRRFQGQPFEFPPPVEAEPIEAFLDDHVGAPGRAEVQADTGPWSVLQKGVARLRAKGHNDEMETCCIDVFSTSAWSSAMVRCSPCLTASRCKQGGHFVSTRKGLMTRSELCRLQCIPEHRFRPELINVPDKSFKHAVGNAMSANVLARVLAHALRASNLVPQDIEPPMRFSELLRRGVACAPADGVACAPADGVACAPAIGVACAPASRVVSATANGVASARGLSRGILSSDGGACAPARKRRRTKTSDKAK